MSSKRAKTSHKLNNGLELGSRSTLKGKQKAPPFDFFQDIPLDIMSEFLRYLGPLDILHLARTTRPLRQFFTSKTSIAFWEQAISRATLPACPDDLSAPEYVNLMFSDHCLNCLRDNCEILTFMEARTQLCEKCALKEFKRWKALPEDIISDVAEFVPATDARLTAKEKKQWIYSTSLAEQRTRFHVATAVRLSREFKRIRGKKGKATWLRHQLVAWKTLEEHSNACAKYNSDQNRQNLQQMEKVKEQRREYIRQRLLDLGFEERYCGQNYDNNYVRGKKLLTETEWDKMKDKVVASSQKLKSGVEISLRKNQVCMQILPAYLAFIRSGGLEGIFPTLAEVALMDEYLPLIDDVTGNQLLQDGACDAVNAKIPEFAAKWRDSQDEVLLEVIRQSTPYCGQHVTKEVLSYASTIFACRTCTDPLTYPTVLIHSCFLRKLPVRRGSKHMNDSQGLIRESFNSTRTWQPNRYQLQFSDAGYYHTLAVLDSLGKALTTSSETMVSLNPCVECLCNCYLQSGRVPLNCKAMRWLRSLYECQIHDSGNYENSFRAINDADLAGLRDCSEYAPTKSHEFCQTCRQTPPSSGLHYCYARAEYIRLFQIEYVHRDDMVVTLP